jgi:hypothetical protein
MITGGSSGRPTYISVTYSPGSSDTDVPVADHGNSLSDAKRVKSSGAGWYLKLFHKRGITTSISTPSAVYVMFSQFT